jgi:hypothetical protein
MLQRAGEIGELRSQAGFNSLAATGFRRVIDLRPIARVRPASP